jgi:hypothetical protein
MESILERAVLELKKIEYQRQQYKVLLEEILNELHINKGKLLIYPKNYDSYLRTFQMINDVEMKSSLKIGK